MAGGVCTKAAAAWAVRCEDASWRIETGGDVDTFFDLASLTKSMTAVSAARSLGLRREPLGRCLRYAQDSPLSTTPLEWLLAHRAGLEANLPLFHAFRDSGVRDVNQALRAAVQAKRFDASVAPDADGYEPLYSDPGYILAGEAIAQAAHARDMGEVIDATIATPLGLSRELGCARVLEAQGSSVAFADRVAPTEVVPWRGGVVRGRVHDENAFALRDDGSCGHAGIFATVRAVVLFAAAALDAIAFQCGPLAMPEDASWLVRPRPGGSLRAGFDGKSLDGRSSAGERSGPNTFGHLGFTGTSYWVDPDRAHVTVLLTNRVHPTRENTLIREARPKAHDALFALAERACREAPL